MASSDKMKKFVNELESFSEKKRPTFESGWKASYSSDMPEDTFRKKKLQGAQAAANKSDKQDKPYRQGKESKTTYLDYTAAGGGGVFKIERHKDGTFRDSKISLTKFRERLDKQDFKSKTEHFGDIGERTLEAVKAEHNEAAASNLDDKAIIAAVVMQEHYKESKKRFTDIKREKEKEIKNLQEIVRREQQENQNQTGILFSKSNAVFTDKGENFTDRYLNAFKDNTYVFCEDYVPLASADYTEMGKRAEGAAIAVAQKKKGEGVVYNKEFVESTGFDRKNNLIDNDAESKNIIDSPDKATGRINEGKKFEETTVASEDNKTRKSVDSYFSNEPAAPGEQNSIRLSNEERLELNRSEKKAANKAKNKAVRRAAAIAAVSNMLRVKKEMQNDLSGTDYTGDLIKDGSSGMLRAATSAVKSIITNKIRSVLIKISSAMAAGLLHIIVPVLPLIVIVVIVISAVSNFLSIFTDSSNIPAGDGYTYASLTVMEVNDIIDGLWMDFPDAMSIEKEEMIRYSLSKVGCAYDQNYHFSTVADIFDCSSLVYRSYKEIGIDISNEGIYTAGEICRSAMTNGSVAYGDLQPGDLIFYGGSDNGRYMGVYHVAMYVGDGKMVEARGKSWGVVYCDVRTSNVVGYSRYI